jgi:ankyrin repeat protein
LALAVQYGNYDLCKLLLENGALAERGSNAGKWNLMDSVAFYNVFAEGQDIPGLLAKKGLKPVTIHQAAGVGDVNTVKELLAGGTSPKKCKDGHRPESCDQPIHWAARSGYAKVIKVLLEAGVRASCPSISTLGCHTRAARVGESLLHCVCALLQADPSVQDQGEDTPMFSAARYGHTEAGKILIDAGAVHTVGEAAAIGYTEQVQKLIAEGASPDEPRRARSQETPLCRAAQKGHTDTVLALIEAGAALDGTDKFGDTALDWSADSTPRGQVFLRTEVMKVLIEKGVRGSQKLCAYAESEEELGLLESYLDMRKAEYEAEEQVAAAENTDAEDPIKKDKPKSMAEELTYCEDRRSKRVVPPGEARRDAKALRKILDKFRDGNSQESSSMAQTAQSDSSREEL